MRRVRATAPVRVADVGGWTDTWFGSPGQVCSVAVGPAVSGGVVSAGVLSQPKARAPVRRSVETSVVLVRVCIVLGIP